MQVLAIVDFQKIFYPLWPSEVKVGDECFFWDEWVPVIYNGQYKRLKDGPSVEIAVGLGAKFRRP